MPLQSEPPARLAENERNETSRESLVSPAMSATTLHLSHHPRYPRFPPLPAVHVHLQGQSRLANIRCNDFLAREI
jgi:hypothetical protein